MKRLLLIALMVSACRTAPTIAAYKPKHRNYDASDMMHTPTATGSPGSLWRNGGPASMLYTDARALHQGDLVTVRIEEKANAQRSTGTDLSRGSDTSASISAYLQTLGKQNTNGPGAGLTTASQTDFSGKGSSMKSEQLTATVPAVVREVLPDGNLFIEGHRVILVNNEEHHFYISGVVRPIDIDQDNSVKSQLIADAEIEFTGQGDMSDNQHQGWLSRLWGFIWPF